MRGSVHKAENGTWSYRFSIEPDPLTAKRRVATKRGFRTRQEANRALRAAITAYESGRRVQPSRRTVEDFVNEWHTAIAPSLRATTAANYRTYLDSYVIPYIGDTRLSDLTPVRLNLLYARLIESGRRKVPGGLSAKTVQNVHRMLHRALRDAVKWDYLPRNVAEDAEPPRVSRPRPDVWTPEQLRAFTHHVRDDRFYALWLLVVTTGFRRGELAGLRRGDIDLDHARVSPTVTRVVVDGHARDSETKTRSGERSLALDPVTRDALRDYLTFWEEERRALGQTSPLLFVWPNGQPLHPDTITALFHKHCEAAGLPRIRLHDVRHSYATAALKAGVPAKIVSERLGHATAAFTLQVYTHVIPGMDQQAATTVADLILGQIEEAQPDGPESGPDQAQTPLEKEADLGESPGQR